MKIGIVSDLHRSLPGFVEQAFRGCERIICAGDAEDERILWQLQAIAPLVNVRGNNDWAIDAPFSATCDLGGLRFFIVHRSMDVGIPADDVQVVVCGHTHTPRDETIAGVRYLNPGSPTLPRRSNPSCMVIDVADGILRSVEIVEGR